MAINLDDYLDDEGKSESGSSQPSPEKITLPLETEGQLERSLPTYDITSVKPVKAKALPSVKLPPFDGSVQTIVDWIRNIERERILSLDAMMLKLESGLIPLHKMDHHWQPNEVIAEDVLMRFHQEDKEVKLEDRVDEIITKHTEGKAQEMARYFVKMVEYKKELMSPILALDSAFFTRLEEIDLFEAALARKQISLLIEIRDGIKELKNN